MYICVLIIIFIVLSLFLYIDLKNSISNRNKTSGYTDKEREGFSKLFEEGFLDSFRVFYFNVCDCWFFWIYMMNVRVKNIGW